MHIGQNSVYEQTKRIRICQSMEWWFFFVFHFGNWNSRFSYWVNRKNSRTLTHVSNNKSKLCLYVYVWTQFILPLRFVLAILECIVDITVSCATIYTCSFAYYYFLRVIPFKMTLGIFFFVLASLAWFFLFFSRWLSALLPMWHFFYSSYGDVYFYTMSWFNVYMHTKEKLQKTTGTFSCSDASRFKKKKKN